MADTPHEWAPLLPWAEYWYNTSYQTVVAMTLFQALYGRKPPTIARYVLGTSSNELVERYMIQRDEVMDLLKQNLSKAQRRVKEYTDNKRQHVEFAIGDWVYVKLKSSMLQSLRLQRYHKLGTHYFGLFKVIR